MDMVVSLPLTDVPLHMTLKQTNSSHNLYDYRLVDFATIELPVSIRLLDHSRIDLFIHKLTLFSSSMRFNSFDLATEFLPTFALTTAFLRTPTFGI